MNREVFMNRPNQEAYITERDIQSQFAYQSINMLTLDITFPEISLLQTSIQRTINNHYQSQANCFMNHASCSLVDSAIAEYKTSIENDFPFRPFEAVMHETVTLNADCHLSTYFDQYEYQGGAHGLTVRFSDSWDLQTGRKLDLKDIFHNGHYRRLLLQRIIALADAQMQSNPIYFENYRELIVQYFNEDSFYLTPEGIAIYYQQYEIGPYASGIIVFEISYDSLYIPSPSCSA